MNAENHKLGGLIRKLDRLEPLDESSRLAINELPVRLEEAPSGRT
jgi:hypothetical protein